MTSERIKQIQETTAYHESVSVNQALLQVWNECGQEYEQQLSAERERAGKLVEALKDAFDEFEDLNLHRQAARIHETLNEYDTATKES